jgi:zinc protease
MAKAPAPSAVLPGPIHHTLPNGLDVIVQEDHAHPLASVQVWVRAGSIHEDEWSGGGMAHLCEHMLFKGTPTRSAQQISQEIQALGGYVNAYTSFNRTVYYIEGLAEKAGGYMAILADMVQRSKFDPEELTREKEVIRREMAMDFDDPGSTGQHLLQSTAFKRHPLRHPIIGHREVFDQISHADLVQFVKRHYSPNNCFLVITGAVDAEAVKALAAEHFGAWQRQPGDPVHLPVEPVQHAPRRATTTFATDITRISVGWPIPGDAHPDKPVLDVIAFLLASGRSSRLYKELRDARSLAHSVWAGAWSSAECGLFSLDVECDPADATEAEVAALEVLQQLLDKGPSPEELKKAIKATLAAQHRTLATTRGQAASLGNGWLVAHSLEHSQHYLRLIQKMTVRRVQEVAQQYFVPQRSSTVVVEPISESTKTAESKAPALVRQPVEKLVLPNGLTVLLGHNPRLPLVSLRAGFLAGVLAETDSNAGVTQVAAQLMLKGTKTRTAEQLASALEERGGSLHANGDAHRLTLGAEVVAGDEALALELMHDLATQATLSAAALESVKKRQLASIREEQEDPLTVALRQARREIFAGTAFARTALGTLNSVPSLKPADCRAHLKSHLVGGNGVLAVFGDFNPAKLKKQIATTLGKLPKGPRHLADLTQLPHHGVPGDWDNPMEKEQAVLVVGFRTVGLHHPDSYVLSMIDGACSDMGSRLFNRIREELGLAYYVGAQTFLAYGAGAFYFYVGTDPAKLKLARKEMLGQITDLAKKGLQADELARAKTTWKSSWLRAQQGNGPLADTMAWDELNGQGYEHFQRLPQIIGDITLKQVQTVAAKYLQPKNAFITQVQPNAKKPKA